MPKRSPFERYRKQQQAANYKYFALWLSKRHPCVCGHPQGFHRDTDEGKHTGRCEPADCSCAAFDEDVFAAAQIEAGVLPTTADAAAHDDSGGEVPLARAMRAEEDRREVSAEEAWDRALHVKRPNPIGKPRPDTLRDPAAMDALRELGGSPEDLSG